MVEAQGKFWININNIIININNFIININDIILKSLKNFLLTKIHIFTNL